MQLSPHQKYQIQKMKITVGWINGYNLPRGLKLNSDGYAVPSKGFISEVQYSFCQTPFMVHITFNPTSSHVGVVKIPPPMNATAIVPPAVNSTTYGVVFW